MKSTEIFNNTRDKNGQFQTGYRATIGTKYVTITYITNWQGDRDKKWRVPIKDFDATVGETTHDKILYIALHEDPCWMSEKNN